MIMTELPHPISRRARRGLGSVQTGLFCAALALCGLGCSDPAASKPKAETSDPKPIASSSATPGASAAPSAAASAAPDAAKADTSLAMAMPDGALPLAAGDSKIAFTGSKVTGKHDGEFGDWKGWINLKDGKVEGAQVHVTIQLKSVKTDSEKLDKHLQAPDFFNVPMHPVATFTSTSITKGGEGDATHTVEVNAFA